MSSKIDVKGGGAKADNEHTVPWGPEHVEDAQNTPAPNNSSPTNTTEEGWKTDDQIMREKEQRQKAEIYRGTRSKFSPAVRKWRQRQ